MSKFVTYVFVVIFAGLLFGLFAALSTASDRTNEKESAEQALADARRESEALRSQIEIMDESLEKAEAELGEEGGDITFLEGRTEDLRSEISKLERVIRQAGTQNQTCRQALEAASALISNLDTLIGQHAEAIAAAAAGQKKRAEGLRDSFEVLQAEIDANSSTFVSLSARCSES